ncbi:hypothetical protein N8996_01710 [Candidatus Poseidonia alphae]|nr:hypothetical protein [Candidatus Poseidonia alphae]
MNNKNPIPIGEPTPIVRERPQLKRTSSIKDLTQENDKISTPNSANMNLKARKFRDIMFTGNAIKLWDKGIGWLLCVCFQNVPFLRKTLLTSKRNIYSYKYIGDEQSPTEVQLYKKTQDMIASVLLGGAAYRGFTNFIAYGMDNPNVLIDQYAPRSHDFDISFGVNNYKRDMNNVQENVVQILIIFLNMMYNELESKVENYWTEKRIDNNGNESSFIPVTEISGTHKKEKILWTHNSGLIQISMLKTAKYTNIRTNIAIQYTNDDNKIVKELDHIIELVFWDMTSKEGTVDSLKDTTKNKDMLQILAYVDDPSVPVLDTTNYRTNIPEEHVFTGNNDDYYNSDEREISDEPISDEQSYPDEPIEYDNDEIISPGNGIYNNLYNTNMSPYNSYFTDTVNITFCSAFRLDELTVATFRGLIGRSSGRVMAKCRQDFSRLYYTLGLVSIWPTFKETQGDVNKLNEELKTLTMPDNWDKGSQEELNAAVKLAIDTNNYIGTNYVQCRTFDEINSEIKKLSDAKFECYSDEACLNSQPDEEKNKYIKKSRKANGYGYGEDNESYPDTPIKDKILIDNATNNDIKSIQETLSNENMDEFGNEYQSIDGCLIDIENGRFFYDPNISINNKELQNITNFLNKIVVKKSNTESFGGKRIKRTVKKNKKKTNNKKKTKRKHKK